MGVVKKIRGLIAVVITICVMTIPVFAASNQVITLPKNKEWITAGSAWRSGNYSTVSARCHSVYPDSGTDNFSAIRCRVSNASGTVISKNSSYTLKESADSSTSISIREGYLATTTVYFQFSENSNSAANAVVSYSGI